jgi:8-amino-7-oxononanoate synthase
MPRKSVKTSIWNRFLKDQIQKVKTGDRYRCLQTFDTFQPGYLLQGNKRYLNLCANDYLGLAADPLSMEETRLLAEILPVGAGASRLITGTLAIHQELERVLADWKTTEAALVFPSGFQTNFGLISALTGKGDAVFCDKLNHASIIDGCRYSDAAFYRYKHGDLDELNDLLKSKRPHKRLIITDGVFSMDGDIAPLKELNDLAKHYDALLLVDEAHATGVLGRQGAGSWSHFDLQWEEHVLLMGTLSKAIGCQGGFVCASRRIIDYLTNYCRSFIYSTALSPLLAGVAHYNIQRIRTEPQRMTLLQNAIGIMRNGLRKKNIAIDDSPVPILSVVLGECKHAMQCAKLLQKKGFVIVAIRPPTVPEGTSRLRISLSAAHEADDLQKASEWIAKIIAKEG